MCVKELGVCVCERLDAAAVFPYDVCVVGFCLHWDKVKLLVTGRAFAYLYARPPPPPTHAPIVCPLQDTAPPAAARLQSSL